MGELLNLAPLKNQLEGCLYRRRADLATVSNKSNSWSYHNHIIQGPYLRFIRRPITSREAASFRLVLVAGRSHGRLTEMLLHSESEVTAATLTDGDAPFGNTFIVNVSGRSTDGRSERWQLALPTMVAQLEWVECLNYSKMAQERLEENGDAPRLRALACKMMREIDIRNRMQRFRVHTRCFMGTVSVKWLMSELNCSASQAVHIGNRMLNAGFFHHVAYEHIYCDRKLFYK